MWHGRSVEAGWVATSWTLWDPRRGKDLSGERVATKRRSAARAGVRQAENRPITQEGDTGADGGCGRVPSTGRARNAGLCAARARIGIQERDAGAKRGEGKAHGVEAERPQVRAGDPTPGAESVRERRAGATRPEEQARTEQVAGKNFGRGRG